MYKRAILVFMLLLASMTTCGEEPTLKGADIATLLMRSTFILQGENDRAGTGFVMADPVEIDGEEYLSHVLITAAHVLEQFEGATMGLHLRKEVNGSFLPLPKTVRIRTSDKPLWTRHDSADVAAIRIELPNDLHLPRLSVDLLATDEVLEAFRLVPGDLIYAIGFPEWQWYQAARWPLLRVGAISSYPILPTANTKCIMMDCTPHGGMSGAPVFYRKETVTSSKGKPAIKHLQAIVGLVYESADYPDKDGEVDNRAIPDERTPLDFFKVAHAFQIRETIDMLPEPNADD